MPLPDLDVLVWVADAGSLTAASAQHGIPRATLSRWLGRLEDHVGTRLVHRTTRQLTLTDAGTELYRRARSIVEAVESATVAVQSKTDVPRGLLRVSMPPGANTLFGSMLGTFLLAYPQVRLEVLSTTRHVDLIAEGIDVAIRAGQIGSSTMVARALTHNKLIAVASPDYLERRGTPQTTDDLADHDCFVNFARGEVPQRRWPLVDGGAVTVSARLACNDLGALVQAAVAGAGIAVLPDVFIVSDLAAGRLVRVLPEVGVSGSIWLVFPERRGMLPHVRAFVDHVAAFVEQSGALTRP